MNPPMTIGKPILCLGLGLRDWVRGLTTSTRNAEMACSLSRRRTRQPIPPGSDSSKE